MPLRYLRYKKVTQKPDSNLEKEAQKMLEKSRKKSH